MSSIDLREILPAPRELGKSPTPIRAGTHLILAAGREDRNLGFLELLSGVKNLPVPFFQGVSLLNYLPADAENHRTRRKILKALAKIGETPKEYEFDSAHSADFPNTAGEIIEASRGACHVYLDISVMSKLLILYLLSALWTENLPFSVIYSEAKKYRPSLLEYKRSLKRGDFGQDVSMEFLFSGVFEPLIPQPFVGRSPLGRPRALVAFLGFNKRQTIGAAAIVPYQLLIPIVGVPPNPEWSWREEALVQINNQGLLASGQRISDIPSLTVGDTSRAKVQNAEYRLHLSTFDYTETVNALLWISNAHRYTHFLTIAPFGSKMQAVGIFLFSRIHPETQIVYAVPRDLHPRYSGGVKATYELEFPNPGRLQNELVRAVSPSLAYLEKLSRD
jgi:hypothetical protein